MTVQEANRIVKEIKELVNLKRKQQTKAVLIERKNGVSRYKLV